MKGTLYICTISTWVKKILSLFFYHDLSNSFLFGIEVNLEGYAVLFSDRDHYQLGTLSHVLNMRCTGYQELPDWPEAAPDPSVRNVEMPPLWADKKTSGKTSTKKKQDLQSFYSESESSDTGKCQ